MHIDTFIRLASLDLQTNLTVIAIRWFRCCLFLFFVSSASFICTSFSVRKKQRRG